MTRDNLLSNLSEREEARESQRTWGHDYFRRKEMMRKNVFFISRIIYTEKELYSFTSIRYVEFNYSRPYLHRRVID